MRSTRNGAIRATWRASFFNPSGLRMRDYDQLMASLNSFGTRATLNSGGRTHELFSLPALEKQYAGLARLPYSLKILLENLLRCEDARFVDADDITALAGWDVKSKEQDRKSTRLNSSHSQ